MSQGFRYAHLVGVGLVAVGIMGTVIASGWQQPTAAAVQSSPNPVSASFFPDLSETQVSNIVGAGAGTGPRTHPSTRPTGRAVNPAAIIWLALVARSVQQRGR